MSDTGELTVEEFRKKSEEHNRTQEENWRRHFREHPEQLLPGAQVKRQVPIEEVNLFGDILWGCSSGPDEGEWTELVDF